TAITSKGTARISFARPADLGSPASCRSRPTRSIAAAAAEAGYASPVARDDAPPGAREDLPLTNLKTGVSGPYGRVRPRRGELAPDCRHGGRSASRSKLATKDWGEEYGRVPDCCARRCGVCGVGHGVGSI